VGIVSAEVYVQYISSELRRGSCVANGQEMEMSDLQQVGFLKSLFDFRLKHFITLRVLSILYAVATFSILFFFGVLIYQAMFGSMRYGTNGINLLFALLLLFAAFVSVVLLRVYVEFVANLYRIGENTKILADNLNRD